MQPVLTKVANSHGWVTSALRSASTAINDNCLRPFDAIPAPKAKPLVRRRRRRRLCHFCWNSNQLNPHGLPCADRNLMGRVSSRWRFTNSPLHRRAPLSSGSNLPRTSGSRRGRLGQRCPTLSPSVSVWRITSAADASRTVAHLQPEARMPERPIFHVSHVILAPILASLNSRRPQSFHHSHFSWKLELLVRECWLYAQGKQDNAGTVMSATGWFVTTWNNETDDHFDVKIITAYWIKCKLIF